MSVPSRFSVMALPAVLSSACVVGAERPASRLEVARPPDVPASEHDAASVVVPDHCGRPSDEPRPPKPAGRVLWIDGYCHFDGVRYRYVAGYWSAR